MKRMVAAGRLMPADVDLREVRVVVGVNDYYGKQEKLGWRVLLSREEIAGAEGVSLVGFVLEEMFSQMELQMKEGGGRL